MSMALKCDACKELFDPNTMIGDAIKFTNSTIYDQEGVEGGVVIRRKGYLRPDLGPDGRLDLCPKCTWYFKKFMSGHRFSVMMKDDETFEEFMAGYPGGEMTTDDIL